MLSHRMKTTKVWCRRGDSNSHGTMSHCALNAARLPIPPLRHVLDQASSGTRLDPLKVLLIIAKGECPTGP